MRSQSNDQQCKTSHAQPEKNALTYHFRQAKDAAGREGGLERIYYANAQNRSYLMEQPRAPRAQERDECNKLDGSYELA